MKTQATKKYCALAILFMIASGPVAASSSTQKTKDISSANLRFTHLTTDNGLSQSSISTILQDRQGFMWFATRDGLNRYDGNTFVVYKNNPDDPESLSYNHVSDLLEDDHGYLWIAGGGVNRFDPKTERFVRYRHDPNNPNSISGDGVKSMARDSRGYLWFGTGDYGLNKFDPATETFTRFRNDSDGKFIGSINSIIEDSHGDIWFVGDRGLFHLNPQTKQITRPATTVDNLAADYICEDKTGNLWMLAYTPVVGLIKYDRQTERLTEYPLDAGAVGMASSNLLDDGQNGFWVPSSQGLYHFDRQTERFTIRFQHDETNPDSLNDNNVVSIFQDRAGLLWVGTSNSGINILNFQQEQFTYYRHDPANPNSLSPGTVTQIYEDPNGILWIGFIPRALDRFDRKTGQITHYVPDPENENTLGKGSDLNSICRDAQGYIWLGGWNSGLDRFDERSGKFKHYRHNPADPNSLISNDVLDVHVDRSGRLWVGQSGGISRFDREKEQFTNYRHDPDDSTSLGNSYVNIIYQDRSGALWFGTWGGVLSRFDDKTNTFVNYTPDSRNPRGLNAIHEDKAGTLWLGASDGLCLFNWEKETFTRYTENQGLPSRNIQGILEDDAGRLWLSTMKGISQFDPRTETFRNYDASDGLQGNEFSGRCYAQGMNGEMFFGGSKGFNAFFPKNIRDNPYVPQVVLTDFQLFNKPVAIGKESPLKKAIPVADQLTLRYDQNVFRLRFAALSFAQPRKNRYAYKLEGFDDDWRSTDAGDHSATYTRLAPGSYTFRVKASNNDGVWNEQGTSIQITVLPPWWATWWFRSAVAIGLLGLVFTAYRLRVRSLQQHSHDLELQVAKRTHELQIAKDTAESARQSAETANRAKSTFLANMSHELRTPLNAVLGFSQLMQSDRNTTVDQKGYLSIINRSGEHLLNLINNVLDISKIESGHVVLEESPLDLHQLLQEMKSLMYVHAKDKGLDFRLEQSMDLPRHISVDVGKLRQVLINLIGNAMKYTTNGGVILRAMVGIKEDNGLLRVRFEVEDTGPGIRKEDRERIFFPFVQLEERLTTERGTGLGLAICMQYAHLMGGEIGVEGESGKGSIFHFEIPVLVLPIEVVDAEPRRGRVVGLSDGQPRYRLLIAEDQPENRLLLCKLLEPFGFDLREAVNGQEAVAIAEQWRPHLIWMDIRMPIMDGLAATRQIKVSENGARIKIVAITAHALEEERRAIVAAGCDDFIRKPYNDADIFEALTKNLGVYFVYKEEAMPVTVAAPLNMADLTCLPYQLRHDLEQALVRIDIGAVSHTIENIRVQQPALADALAVVARDLQLGRMLRMLRAVHNADDTEDETCLKR